MIFLSYRRTDSPQACRIYDWLVQRFGHDSVFMDVAAIPIAVSFPDYIRQAIANSKLLIVLIGSEWQKKIHEADDPVRMEIEVALASNITVLPVLIGNTPMPEVEELPGSIGVIANQNAKTVGVSLDFHSHMQDLLPTIESILETLAAQNRSISDPYVVDNACQGVIRFLYEKNLQSGSSPHARWEVIGPGDFQPNRIDLRVTLFLHRIKRLAELLELHFILSFWAGDTASEHRLAGWVMRQLEQTPLIPNSFFESESQLKVRRSDEDSRQIWKMITPDPLRLSLAYIATVSPRNLSEEHNEQ